MQFTFSPLNTLIFLLPGIPRTRYFFYKKNRPKVCFSSLSNTGARARTETSLLTLDFESSASTNSATPA